MEMKHSYSEKFNAISLTRCIEEYMSDLRAEADVWGQHVVTDLYSMGLHLDN